MTNETAKQQLVNAGISQGDINLGAKLTRRALDTHLNLVEMVKFCERCPISTECHGQKEEAPFVTTERVIGSGPWTAPIMVVSGMPGKDEGKYRVPFVGAEGQLLSMILAKAGVDRNAIYMTYAVKCAGTRQPTDTEVKECYKHLRHEIEAVNPAVIITVGEYAMQSVLNNPTLALRDKRGQVTNINRITYIHTHDMNELLTGEHKQQAKTETWNDIKQAVHLAKQARPASCYDRVGLPL